MMKFFSVNMMKNAAMVVAGSIIYSKFVKQLVDRVI